MKNAIPPIIIFLIFIISTSLSSDYDLVSTSAKPGDDIPWYFIIQDFNDALFGGMGLLVITVLGILFYNRIKDDSFSLFIALLFLGSEVFQGIVILLNTSNIFDPIARTTNWTSHESYLDSGNWHYAYLLLLLGLSIYLKYFQKNEIQPNASA